MIDSETTIRSHESYRVLRNIVLMETELEYCQLDVRSACGSMRDQPRVHTRERIGGYGRQTDASPVRLYTLSRGRMTVERP